MGAGAARRQRSASHASAISSSASAWHAAAACRVSAVHAGQRRAARDRPRPCGLQRRSRHARRAGRGDDRRRRSTRTSGRSKPIPRCSIFRCSRRSFRRKRPFFLEDSRIFVLPYRQMPDFYSRRIGQASRPDLSLNDGEEARREARARRRFSARPSSPGKSSGLDLRRAWRRSPQREYARRRCHDDQRRKRQRDGDEERNRRLLEPAALYSVGRRAARHRQSRTSASSPPPSFGKEISMPSRAGPTSTSAGAATSST